MKRELVYLLASLGLTALPSCLIYPRLSHVYVSPELSVAVVDSSKKPVIGAQVICQSYHHRKKYDVGKTDAAGKFYFPARRQFRVLDIMVMDPSRYLYKVRVFIKTATDSQYIKSYRYYASRHKEIVADTLTLNEKTKLHFQPRITW